MSKRTSSDLSLVMNMLDGLTNSIYLLEGDLSADGPKMLTEENKHFSTIVNRLLILDKDDVVIII